MWTHKTRVVSLSPALVWAIAMSLVSATLENECAASFIPARILIVTYKGDSFCYLF